MEDPVLFQIFKFGDTLKLTLKVKVNIYQGVQCWPAISQLVIDPIDH